MEDRSVKDLQMVNCLILVDENSSKFNQKLDTSFGPWNPLRVPKFTNHWKLISRVDGDFGDYVSYLHMASKITY